MKRISFLIIIIILLISESFIKAETLRETRAVWLSVNYRLDWPPATYDQVKQKAELIKIFDNLKSKNFNTIYFQVRFNGTVLYKSDIEPITYYISGEVGGETSYDPLEFAIKEAHERGFEIHAWINMLNIFNSSEEKILAHPKHLYSKNKEWLLTWVEDNKKSYWLDAGIPEARKYLVDIVTELVSKYDVDGVQYDFLRYPGKSVDDKKTYENYGNGLSLDDFRRESINKIVNDIYIAVKRIKPTIKIGAAPIGIYKNKPGAYGWEGLNDVYQDSRAWLRDGTIDYLAPQIYWDFKNNPRFDVLADDWQNNSYERHIILGIGAYQKSVYPEMEKMINYSRKIGAAGVAFFRYENIKNFNSSLFSEHALPPLMQWTELAPPAPPLNLVCSNYDSKNNSVLLKWDSPKDENDEIKYFSLYKFNVNKPEFSSETMFDIIGSEKNTYTYKIKNPTYTINYFAVKSINKTWVESTQSTNLCELIIPSLYNFAQFIKGENKIMLFANANSYKLYINSINKDNLKVIGLTEGEKEFKLFAGIIMPGRNIINIEKTDSFLSLKLVFENESKTTELKLK